MKKISNIFLILGLSIIASGFLFEIIYSLNSISREASGMSLVIGFIAAPFLAVWAIFKIVYDRKNNKSVTYTPVSKEVKGREKVLSIIFFVIIGSIVITTIINSIY